MAALISRNAGTLRISSVAKVHSKDEILDETGNTIGVNNAGFKVKEKEMFVILRLSGNGKPTVTVLRCLNRIIEPTKGAIIIGDEDVTKVSKERLLEMR